MTNLTSPSNAPKPKDRIEELVTEYMKNTSWDIHECYTQAIVRYLNEMNETKLPNKFLVLTSQGGMYQNLMNIVRVYDRLGDAIEFTRESQIYTIMECGYIQANEVTRLFELYGREEK